MKLRHAALLWLLFGALFMRGALPTGTMLSLSGEQGLSVVLCNAQGAVTKISLDDSTPLSQHGDTCPFALALSLAGGAPALPAALALVSASSFVAIERYTSVRFSPSRPYAARAPPSIHV